MRPRIACYVGRSGRFGRDASLYRHRSQLFGRLWVRLPLPTGQFFSEILLFYIDVKLRATTKHDRNVALYMFFVLVTLKVCLVIGLKYGNYIRRCLAGCRPAPSNQVTDHSEPTMDVFAENQLRTKSTAQKSVHRIC